MNKNKLFNASTILLLFSSFGFASSLVLCYNITLLADLADIFAFAFGMGMISSFVISFINCPEPKKARRQERIYENNFARPAKSSIAFLGKAA